MAEISEATKDKILQSAKKEFLEKGFTAASLRTIAANAGLTTGAMYRHFKDKDALFCALVDDAVATTQEVIKNGGVENHKDLDISHMNQHTDDEKEITKRFIEYIYKNFDAFTLLLTKAAGSTHENFMEKICDIYTENVLQTVHWMKEKFNVTKPIDDMSIHILANATINAFAEIILHKMKKKEALVFISNIEEFFHFGFMHMLGLPCEEK
ncbi:MAG: TetR/AcrR family transcriptional regulator [Spirochaetales bacterium]|nr:TetR/AcrR family transcriptional regulator [Spirochaetales bacterium]